MTTLPACVGHQINHGSFGIGAERIFDRFHQGQGQGEVRGVRCRRQHYWRAIPSFDRAINFRTQSITARTDRADPFISARVIRRSLRRLQGLIVAISADRVAVTRRLYLFLRRFGAAAKTSIEEYGGTILAKGPGDLVETANGGAEGSAAILLEFESLAQAKEFYYSESYQKAKKIRDDGGADVSVMFVEGVPPKFTGLMM